MSGGLYDRDMDNPYRAPAGGKPSPALEYGEYVGYGGVWQRFVALFIDGLIVGAMMFGMLMLLGVAILLVQGGPPGENGEEQSPATIVLTLCFYLLGFVIPLVYNAGMIASSSQATVGKLAMGLKVTDLYGQRISFGRALGREVTKSILSGILFVGYIIACFTERKQALHDLVASTLVLRTR